MFTVYLIRHGEAENNVTGRLGLPKPPNPPLSDVGREQAAQCARHFASIPLRALYASPMRRAVETALPIADKQPPLRVCILPFAKEHCYPPRSQQYCAWGARSLVEQYPTLLIPEEMVADDWEYGIESLPEALDRVRVFERWLLAQEDEQEDGEANIAVVTHGTFTGLFLLHILGGDHTLHPRVVAHNTGITKLELMDGAIYLRGFNDIAHLARA